MNIPKLRSKVSIREFNKNPEDMVSKAVYAYLFAGQSHKEINKRILGIYDPKSNATSTILHSLGITKDFKALFNGMYLDDAIKELEAAGKEYSRVVIALKGNYRTGDFQNDVDQDDSMESTAEIDGKKKYFVSRYEKKAATRKAAVKARGSVCEGCGFDFEDAYGERGKDYIEIHHAVPLSKPDESVNPNPARDFVVLCSNCHRMVHRKKDETLSLEELRKLTKYGRAKA